MKLKPRYSKKLKSSSFEKYNIYPRKVPKQALYCVPETIVFMCLYTLTSRWIMQDQKKLCHAAKFSTWDPRINTCMCFKQNGTKQHRKQHRQQRPDSFNWHFNLNFSLCCQESKLCSNQQIRATWKSLSRIFPRTLGSPKLYPRMRTLATLKFIWKIRILHSHSASWLIVEPSITVCWHNLGNFLEKETVRAWLQGIDIFHKEKKMFEFNICTINLGRLLMEGLFLSLCHLPHLNLSNTPLRDKINCSKILKEIYLVNFMVLIFWFMDSVEKSISSATFQFQTWGLKTFPQQTTICAPHKSFLSRTFICWAFCSKPLCHYGIWIFGCSLIRTPKQ